MRLKSIFISQYKNLQNFSLSFDGDSFLEVFVGKNGSGKSNLFEAFIEVLRHLVEFGRSENIISFDYAIRYEIDGEETSIEWKAEELTVNGRVRRTLRGVPLPDNILIYYSGHNSTVRDLVDRYETAFRRRIRGANLTESRRFIGVGPEYKSLLLTMLLAQPEGSVAREFMCQKLGIKQLGLPIPGSNDTTEPVIKLTLQRPEYARGNREFDIEANDETDRYWKAEGLTKEFLNGLSRCVETTPGNLTVNQGYFESDDRYVLYISISKLQLEFRESGWQALFRQFDNLKTLGMLSDIAIPLKLFGGADGDAGFFSDGQFQAVYIYAVVEMFKDRNCLTLLDEPDAFLHPQWQFEFLKQVMAITDTVAKSNHVLMSSHSAATLCPVEDQQIRLLIIEDSSVSCIRRSKKEIIRELSDSFIRYSEDESKLLIDNAVRNSTRPILFVEGPSDVSILNEAHRKLYPDEDISVLIQDAFDRGFLRTLFARRDLFNLHPQKRLFALFDFDDAHDDWRGLGGDYEVTDIGKGLCKKLHDRNGYVFVLPIPDNELRTQVWDDSNPIDKIRPNPHFCIEHAFWGVAGLDAWFKTDQKSGRVEFKGDKHKVRFATEVVPTLNAACFEVFRPIFEFIRSAH